MTFSFLICRSFDKYLTISRNKENERQKIFFAKKIYSRFSIHCFSKRKEFMFHTSRKERPAKKIYSCIKIYSSLRVTFSWMPNSYFGPTRRSSRFLHVNNTCTTSRRSSSFRTILHSGFILSLFRPRVSDSTIYFGPPRTSSQLAHVKILTPPVGRI